MATAIIVNPRGGKAATMHADERCAYLRPNGAQVWRLETAVSKGYKPCVRCFDPGGYVA